jgi:hypothetical protein
MLYSPISKAVLEGVPGIPVLLLQVLESIIVLQGIPEELPRVRGLGTAVGRLPRLVHTGPQGPWTTLEIGRCQLDIILNDGDPLLHLRVLLLVPYLGGAAGRK